MDKKLVKKQEQLPATVENFISQAIAQGLPVEILEKLFVLYEKAKAKQAKEAYISALSAFQGGVPIIEKTKKVLNKDGRTIRYQYAPIDAIAEQIKKPIQDNGLSYRWEVENREGFIKATAIITHQLGHSESSSFEVPVDKEGYMTQPQKYASALTFAKRYSLCNALGISTADEDTDATDVGKNTEPKSLKAQIMFLLRGLGEEPKTQEEAQLVVERLTQLELIDKNFGEVVNRLETLNKEKNEYDQQTNNN